MITLWDVLEHLPDPQNMLLEIKRIIKPDGILILRIPNSDSWDHKLFGQYWAGIDAPRHLYIFTFENLKTLLHGSGFSINKQYSDIGSYLNFVKSLSFYLSAKKMKTKSIELIVTIMKSIPIRIILYPLTILLSLGHRGTSVTVVCKIK